MIWRSVVSALAALPLLLSVTTSAHAHGPAPKGQVIGRPMTVSSTTGLCICDERWYTVGLRPGVLQISARLARCGDHMSATCAISVFLLRGTEQLRELRPGCLSSQANCNRTETARYRIPRKGVYYVLVRGGGSNLIYYSLRVRGPVFALRCGKYC